MFITLEGPEGSGKTTAVEAAVKALEEKAIKSLELENQVALQSQSKFVMLS